MSSKLINPVVYYEWKRNGQTAAVTLTHFFTNTTAATNNQQVIAAVTGKIIRVVTFNMASNGAACQLYFKSASGGSGRMLVNIPINTAGTDLHLPFSEVGIVETNSGEGLFVDAGAGSSVYLSGYYIAFTP